MNVQFNPTQEAAAASPTTPQATIGQAGKDGENSDSSISSSSSDKGFIATILSPFKAIASFIATIFSKIFCCCGDSKEVKALKEQKAALETFQKAMQATINSEEGADYGAAVAALPKDVKDAILADIKARCDEQFRTGQEKHQVFAENMLNALCNITYRIPVGSSKDTVAEVAIAAVPAVQAAVISILININAQLKK